MDAPLTSIDLIFAPYHVGNVEIGPGKGPDFLRRHSLIPTLAKLGVPVKESAVVPLPDTIEGDISRSFEIMSRISVMVADARYRGSFPIVLAGNCMATVGVYYGLNKAFDLTGEIVDLGCVWFDAHDDFNTPDTITSGYLDSMAIAMLGGRCFNGMLKGIGIPRPMNLQKKVVGVGMRDMTPLERSRLQQANIDAVWGGSSNAPASGNTKKDAINYGDKLGRLLVEKKLGNTMVHLDLDCLDISLGRANKFAAPGGLLPKDLEACLQSCCFQTMPVSLTVASLDPKCEGADKIAEIAVDAICSFVDGLITNGVVVKPLPSIETD
ncbi:hypothetical protein B0H63DRAFT_428435 [Podospora didyma]|uniref:Arginase n=1 Tax=Podospora didyma TaxID=330526 RepID=A0AAE0U434_9PEZI|nr:hypothetical protein B0H63DRAFT_428435 [Podospora didyma]